jgi:hypothetical protein
VENDFPSGLANDGLRNTLHHDYVRRDTSLQKVRRDTLPVELVNKNIMNHQTRNFVSY